MSAASRHLLTVWNPHYAVDALPQHVEVLLRHLHAVHDDRGTADDVYVWWGKVRSKRRAQPLPHLDEILAVDQQLNEGGAETVLYLTDYASLYVASLDEIVRELPDGEDAHVPAYYRRDDLACDCWFRCTDIRRVVTDDARGVQLELAKLRNVRYHGNPVTLYGGMYDLPLVVTRDDGREWFSPEEYALADGQAFVEFDRGRAGVGAMAEELREHLLGPTVWDALDPATKSFLATGERLYRENRRDPAFDFSVVLLEYSKALEVEMRRLLRRLFCDEKNPAIRFANVDGATRDLGREAITLGQMAKAMTDEEARYYALRDRHPRGPWLVTELAGLLVELSGVRNRGSHDERLSADEVAPMRRRVMGIGCEGAVVGLVG